MCRPYRHAIFDFGFLLPKYSKNRRKNKEFFDRRGEKGNLIEIEGGLEYDGNNGLNKPRIYLNKERGLEKLKGLLNELKNTSEGIGDELEKANEPEIDMALGLMDEARIRLKVALDRLKGKI